MFAKLFDVAYGNQVLFTKDFNNEGNYGLKVTSTNKYGSKFSVHIEVEDEHIEEIFKAIDQHTADEFAREYYNKSALDMIE